MTLSIGFAELGYLAWALAIVGLWYSGRALERANGQMSDANARLETVLSMRVALLQEVAQQVDQRTPKVDLDVRVPAKDGDVTQTMVFRITAPKGVDADAVKAAFERAIAERGKA